jgi:hypothetical protein
MCSLLCVPLPLKSWEARSSELIAEVCRIPASSFLQYTGERVFRHKRTDELHVVGDHFILSSIERVPIFQRPDIRTQEQAGNMRAQHLLLRMLCLI